MVVNGFRQIDITYSAKIIKIDQEFNKFKNKNSSLYELDEEIDNKKFLDRKLIEKNELNQNIGKDANKGKFMLIRNFIRVVLMCLVWAYGFLKLAQFN